MTKNTIYNSLKKEEKKKPYSMAITHKNGNSKNTLTDYRNNIEQTNIENKTEITKVQPVSEKFFGNFVIEVDGRGV